MAKCSSHLQKAKIVAFFSHCTLTPYVMKLNWKHSLPLFAFAFIFPSCYKGIAKKVKDEIKLEVSRNYTIDYDNEEVEDIGLGELFNNLPEGKTLNIILTHGIGTPEKQHFDRFKELLVKGLLYEKEKPGTGPKSMRLENIKLLDTYGVDPPVVDTSSYLIRNRKVLIYEVNWSPVTGKAKALLTMQLDTNSYRTALTTLAKSGILIDALGDLSLYLSDYYKSIIQSPFVELLEYLGKQEQGDKTIFIGGSTGNQFFFNALNEVKPGKGLDLCRIYMLSNQLPFTAQITMSREEGQDTTSFVKHLYQPLLNYQANNAGKAPHIISFYDPNDVFGYKLPTPENFGIEGLIVQNVRVFNTMEWSFNPEQLRNKYLTVMDAKAQKATFQHLNQNTDRQSIKIDLGRTSKSAKQNLAILGGIIKGSGYDSTSFNSSFKLISYSSTAKEPKPRKVKNGKNKHYIPKKKQNFFVERAVAKWANNQIAKADFDPGIQLPFEYPSKDFGSDSTSLKGIEESIKANKITTVVTLHGMRPKEPDHFDKMVTGIAHQLAFDTIPKREKDYEVASARGKISNSPSVIVREFINENGKSLRFFIVYWSPITMPTKKTLQELEDNYLTDNHKSFVLDLFKQAIINDGLSDIMLTTNGLKPEVHALLDQAFELLLKADPFQPELGNSNQTGIAKNNYLITSSLGSAIMMDYLVENLQRKNGNPNVATVLKKTDQFFMLTNQLPILALRNLEAPITGCAEFIEQIYGNWQPSYPP